MNAPDIFAMGGREDDAELLALEDELKAARSRYDKHHTVIRPLTDDESDSIARQCRNLERRINETPAQTAIGAAVKLRQILWIAIECDGDLEDDEKVSLQQIAGFIERQASA